MASIGIEKSIQILGTKHVAKKLWPQLYVTLNDEKITEKVIASNIISGQFRFFEVLLK